MNMKFYLILIGLFLFVVAGCTTTGQAMNESSSSSKVVNIDKLEIIHFHATQQCYSCILVGDYAKETIDTYFKEELDSGLITFAHVNGELQENKELVIKYGATGSSLWLGVYDGDFFSAEQNVNVWYRLNNKQGYMDYLKGVIEEKLAGN